MISPQKRLTLMLVLLSSAYCLSFLDRLMMAVVAEMVKIEFDLSDKQLFLLTGAAFVLIYGTFGIAAGWLLDRFNKNAIVAAGVVLWSAFTVACGLAQNYAHLAMARAGVGTGESVIVPAAMALISDKYPPEKRPMAMGIFYAGGMIGVLAAWTLGGWVAAHYGWRYAFFIGGPPGLLLALVIASFKLDPSNRNETRPKAGPSAATVREIARNTPLMWLMTGSALVTYVSIGLVHMLGIFFIRSHHMTTSEVGLIFGPVMSGGMVCGLVAGGWIGNRIARRGVHALIQFCAMSALAMIPIYAVLLLTPYKAPAIAMLFAGAVISTLYSPCFSAAYQGVSAPNTRATVTGFHSFLNALIGGALTPFLVGAISDHWRPRFGADSLRYAMLIGLISVLLAVAAFMRAKHTLARSEHDALPAQLEQV